MPDTLRIDVPAPVLDDLRDRLARTRWPDSVAADWDRGTELGELRTLVDHWRLGYDWRAAEARLNGLDHFRTEVEGSGLHYVHARCGLPGAPTLLLLHGWPDSFLRFEKLLPLLVAGERAFDLVVPSIPGYGLSDRPLDPGTDPRRVGELMAGLMTTLGIGRFGVHGGDIGSGIGLQLALREPDRVIGLHLTDVPFRYVAALPAGELSGPERDFLDRGRDWVQREGAYGHLQGTKPQTLAYALNDSPAGLAAWFLEKFRSWSDCDGNVYARFTADELLTNLTLYWVTQTAGSAARYYYETQQGSYSTEPPVRVEVPSGFALFPRDLLSPPRELAERWFDVRRWSEMPRGGHFAALEEPELLAAELHAFFDPLVGR